MCQRVVAFIYNKGEGINRNVSVIAFIHSKGGAGGSTGTKCNYCCLGRSKLVFTVLYIN